MGNSDSRIPHEPVRDGLAPYAGIMKPEQPDDDLFSSRHPRSRCPRARRYHLGVIRNRRQGRPFASEVSPWLNAI